MMVTTQLLVTFPRSLATFNLTQPRQKLYPGRGEMCLEHNALDHLSIGEAPIVVETRKIVS